MSTDLWTPARPASEYQRGRNPREALALMEAEQAWYRENPVTHATADEVLATVYDSLTSHDYQAASQPGNPHDYTLQIKHGWYRPEFDGVVEAIRRYGTIRHFRGWPYIHLDLAGKTYWTMGYPIPITKLINRKPV